MGGGCIMIRGKDGNEIDEKYLYVSRKYIDIEDLNTIGVNMSNKYDLAISLEVAEHLEPDASTNFVKAITSYSDLVLFSAAIDDQQNPIHTNVRPINFWVDLFQKQGYECFDIIRPELIEREYNVDSWYIQNILLFAKDLSKEKLLKRGYTPRNKVIQFYHPNMLYGYIKQIHYTHTVTYKFYRKIMKPIAKISKKLGFGSKLYDYVNKHLYI